MNSDFGKEAETESITEAVKKSEISSLLQNLHAQPKNSSAHPISTRLRGEDAVDVQQQQHHSELFVKH